MPRANGRRRATVMSGDNAYNAALSGSAPFAMQRPRFAAHVTSASAQKVGSIIEPIGPPETWTRSAYGYYNTIGEVAFVMCLIANTISRCSMSVMEADDSVAPGGEKETKDERALRVWSAFLPAKGGKPELFRKAALQYSIAGESYLLGLPPKSGDKKDGRVWEFSSTREIIYNGINDIKKDFGGWGGKPQITLPEGTDISRFYRADPEFGSRSDSALKHLLVICEEIALLTQVVKAIAQSRLSAGILFVPDEMSFGPDDETEDDSDETDQKDPFTEELIDQLTAPVENRESQASLVPLIMRGPGEFFDKVKLIEIARSLDTLYTELRQEAIHRLAVGLDVPPEMLEGKSNLSHWGSYNVDSQFISDHVEPVGVALANFLTESYLWPALVEHEDMSEEEASKYFLKLDTSKITSKQDASGNARALYQLGVISEATLLRENGLDESDAPTEKERMIHDLRNLMKAEPVVYGRAIMEYLYPELEGLLVVPGFDENGRPLEPISAEGADPGNPSTVPERKNMTGPSSRTVRDQDSGQGEPTQRGPAGGGNAEESSILARLGDDVDAALAKIMEGAGSAIISRMNSSHEGLKNRCSKMAIDVIPGALSKAEWRALGTTPEKVFDEGWEPLMETIKDDVTSHFKAIGYNHIDSVRKGDAVALQLTTFVRAFAITAATSGNTRIQVPRAAINEAFQAHAVLAASTDPVPIKFYDAG
jgi:hypothetical protein